MQIVTDIENYIPTPCAAAIGSFDGVHLGHLSMLAELRAAAAAKGLPLMVVTFATHPRSLFNEACEPFLLTPGDEKPALLSVAGVDICVLLKFDKAMAAMCAAEFMRSVLVERLGVKMLAVGYDHHFGRPCPCEGLEQYISYGKELGVEVFGTHPYVYKDTTVSSSAVRRRLAEGDVSAAEQLLGRRYMLAGTVEHGAGIGRKMGFPTANIRPGEAMKLLPADGVYEVAVHACGEQYRGVVNIGVKPTVANSKERTIEVHIIEFSGDIYGKPIEIAFVRRLRGELEFKNIEALRFQIEVDVARVKRGI